MYKDEKICKMELGSNYYLHLFFSQSTLFFNAFLESVHVCVCVTHSLLVQNVGQTGTLEMCSRQVHNSKEQFPMSVKL